MTSSDTSPFAYLENSKFLLFFNMLFKYYVSSALPAIPFIFCQAGLFSFSCAIVVVNMLVSPAGLRTL